MRKKLLIVLAALGALLAAAGYGYKHRYAASIGIIGGADGPTAILVAGKTGLLWYAGTTLMLTAATAVILWAIKRRRK